VIKGEQEKFTWYFEEIKIEAERYVDYTNFQVTGFAGGLACGLSGLAIPRMFGTYSLAVILARFIQEVPGAAHRAHGR
jgi:hypothetical protein